MRKSLRFIKEPALLFNYNQTALDPRDGLSLFGPYEPMRNYSVQAGVIGTREGINLYQSFVTTLRHPILTNSRQRPSYLGFDALFNISWDSMPVVEQILDPLVLQSYLNKKDLHERTYAIVSYILEKIQKVELEEEAKIDIWFVVIPKDVWRFCRPKSDNITNSTIKKEVVEYASGRKPLFPDIEDEIIEASKIWNAKPDFHDQLKARLLHEKIKTPVQVIVESTLEFKDKYTNTEYEQEMQAHLAWTQASTVYYKLGKLPWKLNAVREGVCYVGLVFKKYDLAGKKGFACSAAQMFLDSGDGTVFKGNVGPWQSKNEKDFHLDSNSAQQLIQKALLTYKDKHHNFPKEVFIHGKAAFSREEWDGFDNALKELKTSTNLVGIVIKETSKLKIFRDVPNQPCQYGNLRGLSLEIDDREAYLWTNGFVPRLNTSTSLEIPNPLRIQISRGQASIQQVLEDVLALTKLNYNACLYGDGLPVTLRFSGEVGNILTAIDNINAEVLPFKYYI